MSSTDNLDRTAIVGLVSHSSPDSDTAELILHPSLSTTISPASAPATSSSSSSNPGHSHSPPLYYTAVTAETRESQKDRLLEHPHKHLPHIASFDEEKTESLKENRKLKRRLKSPARMVTSLEDITSLRLWKGIVAEFVGTLLLTLVGCGSCINLKGADNTTSPVVQIALCFGLSVATIVWSIAHISGGHINPAVTIAMLATRKISLAKAVFFILFQLIGAVVGAGILFGLTPAEYHGQLGMTTISKKINLGQAIGVELFITFILVFTVFASCDSKRRDVNGSTPLSIGLSVTMCHLWAIDFTGSSMNTARSFGPALIMGEWDNHWVYWLGPILGGVVAGLLYEHLFAVNASLVKAKACLLSSDYDDDKYKAKKIKVRIIEEDPVLQEHDDFDLSGKEEKYSSNA